MKSGIKFKLIGIIFTVIYLVSGFALLPHAANWTAGERLILHNQASPYDYYAAKDPTIVYAGGKYHVFYTGANKSGGWQMLYTSASSLSGLKTAKRSYMSKIGEGYFCAPQVFYFEPKKTWFLVYQDGKYGAAYATTTNIADPNSWSGPKSFGISGNMGWDYYVICDNNNCYMYNSPSDNSHKIFIRKTTVAKFPAGWSSPSVSITDTFEGAHVYKSQADGKYYLLVEDQKDGRYYELWKSSSAGGPWTKVNEKWAYRGNLTKYSADKWTTNVSHGELIRAGANQKLEIKDINAVDFLIQGTTNLTASSYQQILWDIGVISNYTGSSSSSSTSTSSTSSTTSTSSTSSSSSSGNLAVNGGVESGLTNWSTNAGTLTRTNADKHNGTASALITGRTAAWHGITFTPGTLTTGNSYNVSVWVKLAVGSANSAVYLTAKRQDDSDTATYNEFTRVATATATASGWTLLQGTYTQSGAAFQHFIIETANTTVGYYADDISITLSGSSSSSNSSSSSTSSSGKFVGNITHSGKIPPDFLKYWNQLTLENEGKWASVESTRGTMNWTAIDNAYKFAKQNGIPFKHHTFVWGAQYPSWMNNLSVSSQKAEVEEWIKLYCQRYPDTELIDVVNEPDHKSPGWYTAIGGAGTTGHDWVIWSFQKARQYCPKSKLILNDYNVLRWETDKFVAIANKVKAKGLLDGVGCQAHGLESQSFSELQTNFNKVKGIGVPIYISEYDVNLQDDNQQLSVMKQQFPLFYESSNVAGITLWGYIYGQTWVSYSGLIKNGSPRPAMTWLMNYLKR